MGYLSCKAESAVITCDSYHNKEKLPIRNHTKLAKLRRFRYEELESATGGFSPDNFLGKGSHGWVYKAVLDAGTLVAAVKKTITASHQEEESKNVKNTNNNNNPGENEIEILSRIRNPYLVNLLGYSVDSYENKKLIVVEFMANGSLYDHLHLNLRRPPGWAKRIRYALQIANAVESLHSANPPVIHRDIKSSNVLIDENWNAKLGDFGLALRGHVEDVRIRSTPPLAGLLGYLDPGYVTPENLSTKSDVFSFGILLLEIVSGRNAIDVNFSPPSLIDWAVPIIKIGDYSAIYDPRIGLPNDLSVMRQLAVLAARCVRSRVDKRPSMVEVVNCLRAVSKRVPSPIWNNLAKRMRKTSLITGSKPVFEMGKEVSVAFKPVSRNPLRSRKVSNFQSGMVDFVEEPSSRVIDRGVCGRSIGSVNELKVESHSKVFDSSALVRTDLAVRMPRVKLINSRSMGVSRNGYLVHDGETGHMLKMVTNPHVRGIDMSRLVINVKTKTQQRSCHQRTESF